MKIFLTCLLLLLASFSAFSQNAVVTYNTIADMLADTGHVTDEVYMVKGYHLKNDGGGGSFYYVSTRAGENDGGSVLNGWVRIIENHVSPEMWGAWHDGIHDDANAINSAILYAFNKRYLNIKTQPYEHIPALDFYSTYGTYGIGSTVQLLAGIKYDFNNATLKAINVIPFMVATPPSANSSSDLPPSSPYYDYSSDTTYGQMNINVKNLVIDGNGMAENGLLMETSVQGSVDNVRISAVTNKHWNDGFYTISAAAPFGSTSLSVADNAGALIYRNANILIYRPSQNRYLRGVYQVSGSTLNTATNILTVKLTGSTCENVITGDQLISLPTGYVMNSNEFSSSQVSSNFNGLGIMAGQNYLALIFDDSRFYNCFTTDNLVGFASNGRDRDRIYSPTFQHNSLWNLVIVDGFQYLVDGWYPEVSTGNAMVNNENYANAFINCDGANVNIQMPVHYAGSGGWFRLFEIDGRAVNINVQTAFDKYDGYTSAHGENAIVKLFNKKFQYPSINLNLSGIATYSQLAAIGGSVIDTNYRAYGPAIINGKETSDVNFMSQAITHAQINYDQGSFLNFFDPVIIKNAFPRATLNATGLYLGGDGSSDPAKLSSHADLEGQTTAGTVTTVTNNTAINATYTVGGYLNINFNGGRTITLQLIYTDENNIAQSVSFGSSSVGYYISNFYPVTVRVRAGSTITLLTTAPGPSTISFDTGGYINRVY